MISEDMRSGGADKGPRLIAAEIYRQSTYGGLHPLRIPRVSTVVDLSRALGWLPPAQYITSPRARAETLTAWHTPGYIAALQAAERDGQVSDTVRERHGLGTVSNPVFGEMFRRPATAAGASILAGEMLVRPGVVYSPASGTHHGMPDRANGFCYLNDPVFAILSLRARGLGPDRLCRYRRASPRRGGARVCGRYRCAYALCARGAALAVYRGAGGPGRGRGVEPAGAEGIR